MRTTALIAASAVLLGFTTTVPARHPAPITTTRANVYVHDPYVTNLFGNTTGKVPPSNCTASQALGLYDDGGSLGLNCIDISGSNGSSVYAHDGGPITTATSSIPPDAPSAGLATLFFLAYDGGFPAFPLTVDGVLGAPVPVGTLSALFQNFGTFSNWNTGCARVVKQSTASSAEYNHIVPAVNLGAAALSWATTNFLTRTLRLQYGSSGGINSTNGNRADTAQPWRGDSAGAGGFVFWTRAAIDTTVATQRLWIGLFSDTAFLSATADPNTALDTVYFGCNAADSNISICSNDTTSTATCTSLGASFPCKTAGALYDFWLIAAPNASSISYNIERLDSAASAFGTVSSDLPSSTVQLSWQNAMNSAGTASQTRLFWSATCISSNQ